MLADAVTGFLSRFEGQAAILKGEDGYVYEETGTLHPPSGPPLVASRRYLWLADGQDIRVSFEDGRPFHRLSLEVSRAEDRHDCAPDLYLVRYDFDQWPEWTSRWTVTGPRKNYLMTTRYTRASQ